MLFGGFANAIFNVMFNLVSGLMHVAMGPINLIIGLYMPDVQTAIQYMNLYISKIGDYLSFALSYLGFYPEVIASACILITAIVMIPFTVHGLKLILRWYRILMP